MPQDIQPRLLWGKDTQLRQGGKRNGWTHHTKVSWELFRFILAWPTLALWSEGLNQGENLRWNCIGIPKACSSLSGCILDQPKRPSMFWQFYLWVYSHLPNSDNLKKGSLHKWAALTTTSAAAEIVLIVVAELCSIMHKETVNPRQTNQSLQRGNDWGCVSINWCSQTNNGYGGKNRGKWKDTCCKLFYELHFNQVVMNKT